ncbi:MAG: ACP S-malonyltransferase [Alphaproteobacteria bacterium]
MPKTTFLFPGQGAQFKGMGADLYEAFEPARKVYDEANELLGWDLKTLCFEGPSDELNRTAYSQPAILTTSLAALAVLKAEGAAVIADCSAAAGLSLGEYTALVMAGALTFANALKLVALRGRFMEEAGQQNPGSMAAVVGLDEATIESCCLEASAGEDVVVPANYNSPGQVVVSGSLPALDRAADLLTQRGAKRVIRLAVSGAFHSPLMAPAKERLAAELKRTPISVARFPVVANAIAEPLSDPEAIRSALVRQMTSPVRWRQCVSRLIAQGTEQWVEVAPGKVLAGLMRRIDPGQRVLSVATAEDCRAVTQNVL